MVLVVVSLSGCARDPVPQGTRVGLNSVLSTYGDERRRQLDCSSNLKMIGLALQMYASDYDDALLPEAGFPTLLRPYLQDDYTLAIHCPSDLDGDLLCSYTFNPAMAGHLLATIPANTAAAWCREPFHQGTHNCLRANGVVDVIISDK